MLASCEEDRGQAEAVAFWLNEHRLHKPIGPIGSINRITVESAEMIRMNFNIPDRRHAEAIDTQSLMFQNIMEKYACPRKVSPLWSMLGEAIMLRVDLMFGDDHIASAICKGLCDLSLWCCCTPEARRPQCHQESTTFAGLPRVPGRRFCGCVPFAEVVSVNTRSFFSTNSMARDAASP